jgi:hypothetical protein
MILVDIIPKNALWLNCERHFWSRRASYPCLQPQNFDRVREVYLGYVASQRDHCWACGRSIVTCLTTYKNLRFQQTSLKAAGNYPVTTNQVSVVASLAPAVNKSLATN